MVEDVNMQYQLNAFDVDGDGIFGKNEISPELQALSQKAANDVGRNFLVFTGAFFAVVIAGLVNIVAYLFERRKAEEPGSVCKGERTLH